MFGPQPGEAALVLLKNYEQGPNGGFAPVIYRCPAGYPTIGWGHRVQPNEWFQQPISPGEAENLLRQDLRAVGRRIAVLVRAPLTQSMMDALACFAFNVGSSALQRSTLLRRINALDYAGAASEFLRWDKARNPRTGKRERLPGLTRRRQAERALFVRDGIPCEEGEGECA